MRGIEGARIILEDVRDGAFASETLRKYWSDIEPKERVLSATLVYSVLRRQGLWKHLLMRYCKRPAAKLHPRTFGLLILGIAGTQELRHFAPGVLVNAIVQQLKKDDRTQGDVGLANAVLHKVMEAAPPYLLRLYESASVRDLALIHGVPGWVAAQWVSERGAADGKQLIRLNSMKTFLSLRVSPGVNREDWAEQCRNSGKLAWPSPLMNSAVRMASNPFPVDLPGYAEGEITPQTESSMMVGDIITSHIQGGYLLDMCAGRGVKTAQLLKSDPSMMLEGWDISPSRIRAAEKEMIRLGVGSGARLIAGNALTMQPQETPSAVFLDAPCTGSGTWGRHPEGKWRCQPQGVLGAAKLQADLLTRAAELVQPGGLVFYSTCSVFREENESVVASVLQRCSNMLEIPMRFQNPFFRRGKPFGGIIWPGQPWIDGFYTAILQKRL